MAHTADWPIEWEKRSDWTRKLELIQNGQIWKLRGYSVAMKVYDRKGGVLQIELNIENGRVEVDEGGGIITFSLPAATIDSLTFGRGYHETFWAPSGQTKRRLTGHVKISE